MIDTNIRQLVAYAIDRDLIDPRDSRWAVNRLLEVLRLDAIADGEIPTEIPPLEEILAPLLDDAAARGLIENSTTSRDLFDTKLMGALTPPPSQVIDKFQSLYAESPEKATDFFTASVATRTISAATA